MAISKKLRFEVFKRDKFTCQYCGKKTPDVVLEIDHIIPLKEKGSDDIQNLITSCFECNRGKSGTPLEQVFTRKDLSDDLYVLAEKELQLKEYNKLLGKKRKRESENLITIDKKFKEIVGDDTIGLTSHGQQSMKYFLRFFVIEQILEAIELACWRLNSYKKDVKASDIFSYTCGILHNWRKEKVQGGGQNTL